MRAFLSFSGTNGFKQLNHVYEQIPDDHYLKDRFFEAGVKLGAKLDFLPPPVYVNICFTRNEEVRDLLGILNWPYVQDDYTIQRILKLATRLRVNNLKS